MTSPSAVPRPMAPPDLAGLLAPARRGTAAAEAPAPATGQAPARLASRPEAPVPPPGEELTGPDGDGARQYLRTISVYLPRSLHRASAAAAAAQGTTRTALILRALNSTHELIGAELAGASTGGADLFDIPQDRAAAEPQAQTTIRVTDAQLAVLQRLAARHGVNRSKLVATALRLHLPGAPPRGA